MEARAELEMLGDDAMSQVQGAGLGLVLEDFVFNVDDATTRLTGIDDSQGNSIVVDWTELYIMGSGSNNGTIETAGQIGSLAHPITLKALDYTEVPGAPENVAILEFAGPNYAGDTLNDTSKYGLWSLYQGCLWGDVNCNDETIAASNISTEITVLTAEQSSLESKYSNFNLLKTGIDSDLVAVQNAEDNLVVKVADAETARLTMVTAWDNAGQPGTLGQEKDCGAFGWGCDAADDSYNNTAAAYQTEVGEMQDAQRQVGEAWQVNNNGVKLVDRLTDFERYELICGGDVAADDRACVSGIIESRRESKASILLVAGELQAGGSRRDGLDIGSKFSFEVYDSDTGGYRTDYLDFDLTGVTADGSYLRLWSENDKLDGELNIVLYADTLNISTCGISNCTNQAQKDASTIFGKNVYLKLALGYGEVQPLSFTVTSDGQFELELSEITYEAVQNGFYMNAPKSNLFVGNINLGGNQDLGSLQVKGLSANYLRVRSHDL